MHKHYPMFMTVLSVVILLLLLGYPGGENDKKIYVYQSNATTEKVPAQERTINNLRDLNNALVDIASGSTPAVVTVRTEQTVRMQQRTPFDMFREFFGEDPFNDRNGNRGGQREFRQHGLGSGVIVAEDGYILTNNHVIAGAETIYVGLENGDTLTAEVVGADPESDIAVLRVGARGLPYMTFGDSDDLRVGEMVMAVGSPLSPGLAHSVSQGIVSATGRGLGLMQFENFIQTDAAINRGNSGGPLVNMNGEIIGINTAIASQSGGFQGIGFAIPSNLASFIMQSIIEDGTVVRGFIGIQYTPVDENIARAFDLQEIQGILINDVVDDSPAQQAGLESGDVIVEVNGDRVVGSREFQFEIANMRPGEDVNLTFIRNGERQSVDLTLAQRPTDEVAAVENGGSVEDITGFAVRDLTSDLAERLRISPNIDGVVVEDIDQNSNAYRNNLRQGDVIIAVNRQPVSSRAEFNQIINEHPDGEIILLQVIRENTRFFVAFEPRS